MQAIHQATWLTVGGQCGSRLCADLALQAPSLVFNTVGRWQAADEGRASALEAVPYSLPVSRAAAASRGGGDRDLQGRPEAVARRPPFGSYLLPSF